MLLKITQKIAETINDREPTDSPMGKLDIKYFISADCVKSIRGQQAFYVLCGQVGLKKPYRLFAKILQAKGLAAVSVAADQTVIIEAKRSLLMAVILKNEDAIEGEKIYK